MSIQPVLAVIPARGGSKGLPQKNILPLRGIPLIAHTLECARRASDVISRCIVSTDSETIASVARAYGGDTPFLRPGELAGDDVPMLPVLQHALSFIEAAEGRKYGSLLLLDPTSPGRTPEEIRRAVQMLADDTSCDGIIGVSRPSFSPHWHGVIANDEGLMQDLIPRQDRLQRRQDVPEVFRINGCLYLWRRDFLLASGDWREGRLRMIEIPESRAFFIDDPHDMAAAEALLAAGVVRLPWLEEAPR